MAPLENPDLIRYLQQLVVQALCVRILEAQHALFDWLIDA